MRWRARVVIPVVAVVVALGAMTVAGLSNNVVYFRTVSEAVGTRAVDGTERIRIAGAVVPGTVEVDGEQVSFNLTDGLDVIRVHHRGAPPELFGDGAPVVGEGSWSGDEFHSDRLMIKHGSEYEAPDVDSPEATDT